ncbi:MAG: glycosyltransferase family 2 protein [Nitrospirae bacterium]|nr:glycosyltransferase family 2 protein [Nitrospirota bacterium]
MNGREKYKISVVIPCYNEQDVLPELFRRMTDAAEGWGVDWEIICIDDGSHDNTWALLSTQHANDPRWSALSFSRNFGHQTAVSAGIFHATGDAVIVIDADLQDPPEEIHRFIKKWLDGYDIVYAVREHRKEGILKKISYWTFYRLLSRMIDFDLPLDSGDFCIMDRKIVDILNTMPERNRFVRGLRAWAGFRQTGLAYERHARTAGESKYDFKRLRRLALDGIISFSTLPLSMATNIGLWTSALSFLGIILLVLQYIFRDFFESLGIGLKPGFSTHVTILFLGGVQLIFLGIIGQYLGRIYDEVKQRPRWIIKQHLGLSTKPPSNPL